MFLMYRGESSYLNNLSWLHTRLCLRSTGNTVSYQTRFLGYIEMMYKFTKEPMQECKVWGVVVEGEPELTQVQAASA